MGTRETRTFSLSLSVATRTMCEPVNSEDPCFFLAQEFYWLNPAKLPNPVQWMNVDRVRVKDAVEPIWWLSKTEHPKADNRKVLIAYSKHMERLLATNRYNRGPRPSGWVASDKWGKDNGGAIPPNFLATENPALMNLLVEPNTGSAGHFRNQLREKGITAHPAMFPSGVPKFFIAMATDPGDIVLDPFAGSNTTGHIADTMKRQWLSIDLDSKYLASV